MFDSILNRGSGIPKNVDGLTAKLMKNSLFFTYREA